jgi:uncharacterized protein (TIGR02147 family)
VIARGSRFAPLFEPGACQRRFRPATLAPVKTNALAVLERPTATTSFRLFLQSELGRRCARNSKYSLRAFARFLATDHATLSQLMRGKRRLTARTIGRLGARLGLEKLEIDDYVAHEARVGTTSEPIAALREVRQLAHDTAALISDWHHYALLELTHICGFQPDTRWIARVLGMTADEVNVALTRLIRLGLLEMTAHDQWIDKSGHCAAELALFTQVSIERLCEQARGLLLAALRSAPANCCDYSSTTLAVDTARMPAVIERIAQFRRELAALLDTSESPNDVYQLEISLFPVTTLQQHKDKENGSARDAVANRRKEPR